MSRPFVITGTGRSGTMGMSMLLNQAGVRTAFEEFFCPQLNLLIAEQYTSWLGSTGTAGEVSSLAAPYLPHLKADVVVLHQVRNPVATLASLMGEWGAAGLKGVRWYPNVKFNRRYLQDISLDDPPLVFYMKYWLGWNELIEPRAQWHFRIETVDIAPGAIWERLLQYIDVALVLPPVYERNYNTGPRDKRVTWRSIPESDLKKRILEKAIVYGYSEADLDAYCPCPAECPHCNKGL